MKIHFRNKDFDYQLLRTLSHSYFKGAEIGECIVTAELIKDGSFESWYYNWHELAKRIEILAQKAENCDNLVSAKECYLRASNYYRTAEFFLAPKDSRKIKTYLSSVNTFRKAIKYFKESVEILNVKYKNNTLPGYFMKPKNDNIQRSTIVSIGGFDSIGEELYFFIGASALERDYNFFAFEGPGQGNPLRMQGLVTQIDYEVPVKAILDYLEERTDIDKDNIYIIGTSMGGYYAPRACAFDNRIKGCIVHSAFYDMWDMQVKINPIFKLLKNIKSKALVDLILKVKENLNPGIKWSIQNALYVFGLKSRYDLIKIMPKYSLKSVIHKIKCPVLILHGENDHMIPQNQAFEMYNDLKCDKTLRILKREDGAEEHCNFENYSLYQQIIFEWLDKIKIY